MIAFVLIAAAMVATALAWVLVPLLKRGTTPGVDRETMNVAILRDQMSELNADLASGTMSREQYDEARRELEQRVLEDSKVVAAAAYATPQSAAWTAAIVAGTIPIAALLLYVTLGNHEAFAPEAAHAAKGGAGREVTREQVEGMAAKLKAKLEKEPANAEGWVMLARTYYALNRYADAESAFEKATALVPDDAGLLADYADAVGAVHGGLRGKALELVDRALKADPTQWKALALAGTAAFERKDYKQAVAFWERMKASVPPGSQMAGSIDASIAEARELGGLKGDAPAASTAIVAAPAAAVPKAAPGAARATGAIPAASVAGSVSLAPALAAQASPTDTVFIFARAADGPRMPLAILRKQVKDLPTAFTLDDSMAMAPNVALSNFASIVVGARVSKSGNATPQSGDLEGFSTAVKVGAAGLAIVIDHVRP